MGTLICSARSFTFSGCGASGNKFIRVGGEQLKREKAEMHTLPIWIALAAYSLVDNEDTPTSSGGQLDTGVGVHFINTNHI